MEGEGDRGVLPRRKGIPALARYPGRVPQRTALQGQDFRGEVRLAGMGAGECSGRCY